MLIEIKDLKKSFKNISAVDGVSLEIAKGAFVALLGPNGAGKTTLVEMIEGIQKPDSGHIRIAGMDWDQHQKKLRTMMGICLQETKYMEKVTVDETITLFAAIYKTSAREIAALYETFGLGQIKKQYILDLSGGQRQKVSLMLALINNPQLLILDEPTTGLDPAFRREIWALLLTYKEKGLTMILTTHYMEEASVLCDHIVLMNKGRIVRQGNLKKLLETLKAEDDVIVEVKETERMRAWARNGALPCGLIWNDKTQTGSVETNEPQRVVPQILTWVQTEALTLLRIECKRNTLEDVFIHLTGERLHD